jgi:hypothetical protein
MKFIFFAVVACLDAYMAFYFAERRDAFWFITMAVACGIMMSSARSAHKELENND